ncbi:cytochrome c551 [Psychrobacillus sp. NPDC058041]|jgi:cytochrome c551|uniref:cytochrome c551 n=1 Tax=Psychrobacillus sp. NPDC058041 TaxID=3346310 RepID=UPI0036D94C7A
MNKKLLAVIFGTVLMLAACGGAKTEKTTTNTTTTGTTTTETAAVDPEKIVKAKCTTCHGGNLQGQGNFPNLMNVGSRLSKDEILKVLENGRGGMPAGLVTGADADAVAQWLSEKK